MREKKNAEGKQKNSEAFRQKENEKLFLGQGKGKKKTCG